MSRGVDALDSTVPTLLKAQADLIDELRTEIERLRARPVTDAMVKRAWLAYEQSRAHDLGIYVDIRAALEAALEEEVR